MYVTARACRLPLAPWPRRTSMNSRRRDSVGAPGASRGKSMGPAPSQEVSVSRNWACAGSEGRSVPYICACVGTSFSGRMAAAGLAEAAFWPVARDGAGPDAGAGPAGAVGAAAAAPAAGASWAVGKADSGAETRLARDFQALRYSSLRFATPTVKGWTAGGRNVAATPLSTGSSTSRDRPKDLLCRLASDIRSSWLIFDSLYVRPAVTAARCGLPSEGGRAVPAAASSLEAVDAFLFLSNARVWPSPRPLPLPLVMALTSDNLRGSPSRYCHTWCSQCNLNICITRN